MVFVLNYEIYVVPSMSSAIQQYFQKYKKNEFSNTWTGIIIQGHYFLHESNKKTKIVQFVSKTRW